MICKQICAMANASKVEVEDGRAPIVHVSSTHAGLVCPGREIPSGIPTNFGLFQAAEKHFYSTKEEKEHPDFESNQSRKRNLGEVDYKAFYDDLTILNEGEWTDFFAHPNNYRTMTSIHGVLTNLGNIYFKRGVYESSGEVFEKAAEIIQLCKQHCSNPDLPYLRVHIPECDQAEYEANTFRSILNMQLKRYRLNIPVWLDACAYEAKYLDTPPLCLDNQPYLCCLQKERGLTIHCIPTVEEIHTLSDNVILKCMKKYRLTKDTTANEKKETQLLMCDHCNKQELAMGEFKMCPRCNKAVYCGKVCQKASWKLHKKVCGKKN